MLDTMVRLCQDVIAALQVYITTWCARFWQDGRSPSQWEGYSEGVNGVLLEVFVTDTRQQALAACEWAPLMVRPSHGIPGGEQRDSHHALEYAGAVRECLGASVTPRPVRGENLGHPST